MKIAYLANRFPSSVELYVMEEIAGLRAVGIEVLPSSARRAGMLSPALKTWSQETLYLQSARFLPVLRTWVTWWLRFGELRPFIRRALSGHESFRQRAKALIHTWLGVYYAVLLERENVGHIHVHHGYFSAWIAMVAARLLGITYSVTLHGSDLLLNAAFLDVKLEHCAVCFTVSEYNREYVFRHYPHIQREKVVLRRLGVDPPRTDGETFDQDRRDHRFVVLAPGRLHPVKDHAFLVAACAVLKARMDFVCFIAGEGPERKHIESQIRACGLQPEIKLLGQVAHEELEAIYPLIDLVVLTSRSEGIPLVLMEAMAQGRPVLAPNITGIPELVADGKTGFLYAPGSLTDFISRFELVHSSFNALGPLRRAAREHVNLHFNRAANLQRFVATLTERISGKARHAHPVLQ
jgi:colanic acid/amylovoran biosynthesis glycosyltransferase